MLLLWGQIFARVGEVVQGHVRSQAGCVPNSLRAPVLTADGLAAADTLLSAGHSHLFLVLLLLLVLPQMRCEENQCENLSVAVVSYCAPVVKHCTSVITGGNVKCSWLSMGREQNYGLAGNIF